MAQDLADLIDRLQAAVAPRGNVPTEAQYQECIEDAVSDYSKRRPMLRTTMIDVLANVAEYDMPDDFWQLVSMQTWEANAGVFVSTAGVVPLSAGFTEAWETLGQIINFVPTPAYSWPGRIVKYLAGHVLDDEDSYPYLVKQDVQVLIKRAQALALGLIANQMAGRVADWSVKDIRENQSSPLKEIRTQIEQLDKEYLAAVDAANRARPVLGHGYTQAELEAWYAGS
jgi:hypothetical protein